MFVLVFVIPFEFRNISKPFFVRFICCELSVQDVFCYELWIVCLPGASLARLLDRGLDASGSAYSERSFVIDPDVVFAVQIIVDPAVSFGWIFHMDFFHLRSYESVLPDSFTDIAAQPLVIC